jgi:hypothetical protein
MIRALLTLAALFAILAVVAYRRRDQSITARSDWADALDEPWGM